jgi:protein translocase SecG subunit
MRSGAKMSILLTILIVVLVIVSILLITIIAIQTTKSEQGGAGMGWGTIGGQATSSIKKFGLDAKLGRITTILAVTFISLSFIVAIIDAQIRHGIAR